MGLDTIFAALTTTRLALPVDDAALIPADDAPLEESPTYRWNGARMNADVGLSLPVVYGRHLIAPNVVNVYVEEGEHDTLNMLLAVCEGEIEAISNVKIDGNPVEDYYGDAAGDPYGKYAEITVRKGTSSQSAMENFGDVHGLVAVSEALPRNVPYEYTTTKTDCECFNIEFQYDKMFQVDANENETSWYAAIRIEYRLAGDPEWISYGVMEMKKNTRSPFKRYFKSEYLTPGQYQIRLTKTSEDEGSTRFGTVRVLSVDEITTEDLQYPGTALLGLRLLASEKLKGGLPNVTCVVSGKKVRVPDVYDGLGDPVDWEDYYWDGGASTFKLIGTDSVCTWDGVSYKTDFCANPAWCVRDLLLDERAGLGQYITTDDIDEASFLAAAKYCDEGIDDLNGVAEKRMRLDLVLDTNEPALDIIYRMCSTFRGLMNVSSGMVRLLVEKAEDPVQMFNMGNIVKDSFSLRYLSKKGVPNVVRLDYTNKDSNYNRTTIEVADETSIAAGEELREQSLQFIGCTRMSQALREGKIILNKLKLNRKSIDFETGWDAVNCQPGDVVQFQHDVPQWGEGGRVQAGSTTTKVVLDKTIELELGKTYQIQLRNNADDTLETRTISDSAGFYNEVNVTPAFSFTPESYDVWSFGITNQVTKLYRVTSVERMSNGNVFIGAVEYNATAYDYSGVVFPDSDWSYLSLDIPNASNVTGEEQVTRLGDGSIDDVVNIAWTKPATSSRWVKKVVKFEIWVSDNSGGSWEFVGETDKDMHQVRRALAVGSTYNFAVVSVTEEGEKKVPATSPQVAVAIEGWQKGPAAVDGFSYTFEEGIQFTWEPSTDENLAGYEIRTNELNWGTTDSNLIWRGRAEKFYLARPAARSGIQYLIKAYNTSGKFSDQAATLSPINPAPAAISLTLSPLFQKVMLLWDDSTDADLVEYEIWKNDIPEFQGEEDPQGVLHEQLYAKSQGTSAVVLMPHDPSYYRIRAVDKYGPGEWSNVVSSDPVLLNSGDIGPNAINSVHVGEGAISARSIQAGQILTAHLGANQITAEKMNIIQISAMSADLGCMTAGTIIGACIMTSADCQRTELNDAGLYSYDCCGRAVVKLEAGELCLIDPDSYCCCSYSYLDHGSLKFHHRWGEIPYAKRICSGSACAGSTVCLCGWYEQPEVMVGIRSMISYDCSYLSDCQEWCVYHANLTQYGDPTVSSNYGWKFDVHAKLSISGGTRPECIYLCDFGQTVTTGVCTCEVLVKEMFQLACHSTAPDTWKYGLLCYEVRYRAAGCGVWCGECHTYEQAHTTITTMGTTYIECQVLDSTQLTPSDCWNIQLYQVCLTWVDSGICSGAYTRNLCCYTYPVDESYWACCCITRSDRCLIWTVYYLPGCDSLGNWCCCSDSEGFSFGHWDTCTKMVCEGTLRYDLYGCMCWCLPHDHDQAAGVIVGCYGDCATMCCVFPPAAQSGCENFYASACQDITDYVCCVCVDAHWALRIECHAYFPNRQGHIGGRACVKNITQEVCFWCCNIVDCVCRYYYCTWVGAAYCCNYRKMYSLTETTEAGTILDSGGMVNFLTIAYA